MFSLIIYLLIAFTGFMMGYLFQKANINAQFLRPDPRKALKLFVLIFTVAVSLTFALSFFTLRSFAGSSIRETGLIHYNNLHSLFVFSVNVFFFLLVLFANGYSQSLKKFTLVPYLLAAGFYILFILKDAYVIHAFFARWQASGKAAGALPEFSTATAWIKCVLGFSVTAFNAAMIWWSLRKS